MEVSGRTFKGVILIEMKRRRMRDVCFSMFGIADDCYLVARTWPPIDKAST